MKSIIKALTVSTVATGAVLAGGLATPASAVPPIAVGNLVNVQVTNLLNNNEVALQVPINVAANICDVDVLVLAADVADGGATCDSRSGNQQLSITQ